MLVKGGDARAHRVVEAHEQGDVARAGERGRDGVEPVARVHRHQDVRVRPVAGPGVGAAPVVRLPPLHRLHLVIIPARTTPTQSSFSKLRVLGSGFQPPVRADLSACAAAAMH